MTLPTSAPGQSGHHAQQPLLAFKLIFEVPVSCILGAQAIDRVDAIHWIDVIASLITMGGTLEDVKKLELCYSPICGTDKGIVNMAAPVGRIILYDWIGLVESGACIIDVQGKKGM